VGAGMSLSYHDTGVCSTAQLPTFTSQARRQSADILGFFRAHPGEDFSPSQVWGHFQQWPLTSIRRAMTNLTARGALEKLTGRVPGLWGKPEGLWTLHRGQGRLF